MQTAGTLVGLPLLHREWTLAAGMGIDGWGATDTHAGVHTGRETVSAMHAVAHMLLRIAADADADANATDVDGGSRHSGDSDGGRSYALGS